MPRPPARIDLDELEKLASIHCTDEEIAAFFGIRRETFSRRKKGAVLETVERGRAKGRASLRRLQWAAAQKGNTGMLIWLGKQLLGQRDETKVEHSGEMTVNDNSAKQRLLNKLAALAAARTAGAGDPRPN